jgi:hypothetical protein
MCSVIASRDVFHYRPKDSLPIGARERHLSFYLDNKDGPTTEVSEKAIIVPKHEVA